MKRILFCSLLVLATSFTANKSSAQNPFEGTWKLNVSTMKDSAAHKPSVLLLQDGVYECKSCPFKGKADGTDQPITGVLDFNSIAVNVRNDHTIDLTFKKDSKVVMTDHMVVSKDGDLLTDNLTQSAPAS